MFHSFQMESADLSNLSAGDKLGEKSRTIYWGCKYEAFKLVFLHHLQFRYSSYLKSTFFLQVLLLLFVMYISNALWDLFLSELHLNGFSLFLGLYCQTPHVTHVICLLLNFLGTYEDYCHRNPPAHHQHLSRVCQIVYLSSYFMDFIPSQQKTQADEVTGD